MGALGGAVLLFAVGPRTRVRLDGAPPTLPSTPAEVADMISKREGAVTGLRPGAEARVTWGGAPGERTSVAFVYVHGFSASRQETAPLSENLARSFSANLYEARLTGHGRSGDALGQATAEDWVRDTREAIAIGQKLGERVVVVACSTGATSTMLVAAEDKPEVAAYVLLSPNFGPRNAATGLLLWPWAETWVPMVMGQERSWEPANEAQGKFWTTRYPMAALFPMMALVSRTRAADLSEVSSPVLVLHSEEDPTVDPESIESAFIRMRAAEPRQRQLVTGAGDHHVLAGDILSPERTNDIQQRIIEFLRSAKIETPDR